MIFISTLLGDRFASAWLLPSFIASTFTILFLGCGGTETIAVNEFHAEPVGSRSASITEVASENMVAPTTQEPATVPGQETDANDSKGFLGKASDLFNKAKQKGAESAQNASGWVQDKYNGTAGATSEAAGGAMEWANKTFESLKSQGMTTANSTSEWLASDWKNMESWEYKVVSNPPVESVKLEAKLNELGAQGWECIDVRENQLVFKKQRESYLRRLPFKDLLKLAPLMSSGQK